MNTRQRHGLHVDEVISGHQIHDAEIQQRGHEDGRGHDLRVADEARRDREEERERREEESETARAETNRTE